MNDILSIIESLNGNQKDVCKSESNIILTACPGSGKTRVITHRLAYLAEKFKKSHKYNIAITYTNRAANEIENRIEDMGVDTKNIWTGTIHQFCMHFIIRPYAMYHKRLNKGYRIIDEYTKEKYFKELANGLQIRYKYLKELFENDVLIDAYDKLLQDNKEIDFELILELSEVLLRKNIFISQNIADIIRSVHVDEYQDTNELQYDILSNLIRANNEINILFVGDINQSIYGNIGGLAKDKDELEKSFGVVFENKTLDRCYRSSQRLVSYYSNFEVNCTGAYSCGMYKEEKGLICYNDTIDKSSLINEIAEVIKKQLKSGVAQNEICVIAPQWQAVYPLAKALRQQLQDVSFDAPDITPIKCDPLNIFYIISKLVFTRAHGKSQVRRKDATMILDIIKNDYNISIKKDIINLDILRAINISTFNTEDCVEAIKNAVGNVFSTLEIDMDIYLKKIYDSFIQKIEYRITYYQLSRDYSSVEKSFKEKQGIVISTIHGVKGEEYETVIAFSLLKGKLPHWDYFIKDELKIKKTVESNKLLYVLASRAKKNLFLYSENGHLTQSGNPYIATEELSTYAFRYDN